MSPLLFCIELNSFQNSSQRTHLKEWQQIAVPKWNNHQPPPLHVNGIKLYAKSEQDLDLLTHTTTIYGNDNEMSFSLNKCGQMVTKRGKVIRTEGVKLSGGNKTDTDSYRYLGILQVNRNQGILQGKQSQ